MYWDWFVQLYGIGVDGVCVDVGLLQGGQVLFYVGVVVVYVQGQWWWLVVGVQDGLLLFGIGIFEVVDLLGWIILGVGWGFGGLWYECCVFVQEVVQDGIDYVFGEIYFLVDGGGFDGLVYYGEVVVVCVFFIDQQCQGCYQQVVQDFWLWWFVGQQVQQVVVQFQVVYGVIVQVLNGIVCWWWGVVVGEDLCQCLWQGVVGVYGGYCLGGIGQLIGQGIGFGIGREERNLDYVFVGLEDKVVFCIVIW